MEKEHLKFEKMKCIALNQQSKQMEELDEFEKRLQKERTRRLRAEEAQRLKLQLKVFSDRFPID